MRRVLPAIISLGLLITAEAASAQNSNNDVGPVWRKATPASVGLDEKVLASLDADLASGKYMLVDSFQVFRCGEEVFDRKYAHDYGRIYGIEAKTKGPLNARLTGPYNYFDPDWHPFYHGTGLHSMQSVTKTVTSTIFGIAI